MRHTLTDLIQCVSHSVCLSIHLSGSLTDFSTDFQLGTGEGGGESAGASESGISPLSHFYIGRSGNKPAFRGEIMNQTD